MIRLKRLMKPTGVRKKKTGVQETMLKERTKRKKVLKLGRKRMNWKPVKMMTWTKNNPMKQILGEKRIQMTHPRILTASSPP